MKRGGSSESITTDVDQRSAWRLPAHLYDYVHHHARKRGMSMNAALILIVGEHRDSQRDKSLIAEMEERLLRIETLIYLKETKFHKIPKFPMGKRI